MMFFPYTTVGEVAAQFPATVRVFQRRKVEFCCGGHQTLAEVCRDIGTPYEILTVELEHAIRHAPARVRWADRPLSELTNHIVEAFHQPLLLELPRLRALITRLQGHGDAHRPVLTVVGQELRRFEARLLGWVTAEEDLELASADRPARCVAGPCGEEWPSARRAPQRRRGVPSGCRAGTIRLLRGITDGYESPSNALRNAALVLQRPGRARGADAAVRPHGNQRCCCRGAAARTMPASSQRAAQAAVIRDRPKPARRR